MSTQLPLNFRSQMMRSQTLMAATLLTGLVSGHCAAQGAAPAAAPNFCIAAPQVAIGDVEPGDSSYSEPLRARISKELSGPLFAIVPLASSMTAQVRAEVQQKNCRYVLRLVLTHNPGSNIGRNTAKAARTVSDAAQVASVLGATGSGSRALGTAASLGQMFGRSESRSASEPSIYPVGKGDRLSLGYSLTVLGTNGSMSSSDLSAKVAKDNERAVEQLLRQAAEAVINVVAPAG
jgi:hypothetical protein